jgi:hypothetical protein
MATDENNKIATSQVALPKDACDLVFATAGYEQSVSNMTRLSLGSDNVFGDDGGVKQLGTITGSVADGMHVAPRGARQRLIRAQERLWPAPAAEGVLDDPCGRQGHVLPPRLGDELTPIGSPQASPATHDRRRPAGQVVDPLVSAKPD